MVHAFQRHTLSATAGQSAVTTLAPDDPSAVARAGTRLLSFHASDARALRCRPAKTSPGPSGSFELQCTSLAMPIGPHTWVVTACDAECALAERQLVFRWLLMVEGSMPTVSKWYEAMGLPSDGRKRLKIRIHNAEGVRKVLICSSSAPEICAPTIDRLTLPAKGFAFLDLSFFPQQEVRGGGLSFTLWILAVPSVGKHGYSSSCLCDLE
eukprot:SAG11_NODE_3684_length_2285_cov_1.829826_2_plen_210_part_00